MTLKSRCRVSYHRGFKALARHRQQVKETIRQNRKQPIEVYRQDSPQFKIYTGR